jgi:hypothetical protein
MSRRIGSTLVATLVLAGSVAIAGCGSSNTSKGYGTTPAVARGNAPISVSFDSSAYPAACQKSLETPNSQGAAFTPAQASTFCTCLVQQAGSSGLASESEASITNDQFKSLFDTCRGQLSGQGSQTTTT